MTPVHYHSGKFPPEERLDWEALRPQIGPAFAAIARYDGMLEAVPNPDLLLAPMATQEAVLSSRIEGTQATMGDVLEFEAGHSAEQSGRTDEIQEIINYRAAMQKAEEMLEDLPLSGRVIREAHEVLLAGARGRGRAPGSYRRIPNWIGPPGSTIDTARYVPPPAQELVESMSRWERYIHEEGGDLLVRTANLHAEFEALHPFLDGNGRMGRMIVPLFLWKRKLIRRPTFYISAYLEANRDIYYEKLLSVSRDDDWTGWCQFFLNSLRIQAENNFSKAQNILALYDNTKPRIVAATRSQYTIHALDWIFRHPIFSTSNFVTRAGIPKPSAHRISAKLLEHGIVSELRAPVGRRSRILVFSELLDVVESTSTD